MPFYSLYSASIIQNGTNIVATPFGKNTITGSWSKLSTGSYQFISSGNFGPTISSGSITGSLGIYFTYRDANNEFDSGYYSGSNINVFATSSNALILQTYSVGQQRFSDNTLLGYLNIDIGIVSGSLTNQK